MIGPGEVRDDISNLVEAGGNGLYWGWNGTKDLIICQHGKSRLVRINIDDVDENGEIDPSLVAVLVDSYNGIALNSPNDVTMHGEDLYFSDPPFGNQTSSGLAGAFEYLSEDIGVYVIRGDPGPNCRVEPERIINFLSRECLHLSCLPEPSFADMACRVGDMSETCLCPCRRRGDIACRLECLNDTTFNDMSPTRRHFGNFVIVVSAQTQKL